MASQPFIVIRLVPESPVDGTTFYNTYLHDLSLEIVDANTGNTISKPAVVSPLTVLQWPPGSGACVTIASEETSGDTSYNKSSSTYDYGDVLPIGDLSGISIDSFVLSADQTTIPADANDKKGLKVKEITPGQVTLNASLPNFVPAGTPVSFIGQPQSTVDLTTAPGYAIFTCEPSKGESATLTFQSGQTSGIPIGAMLDLIAGLVGPKTQVTGATGTTLTISPGLLAKLPANQKLTFRFPLSSGIAQHTETLPVAWAFFFGEFYAVIPAAVATAVLPVTLTGTLPPYLGIKVSATHGTGPNAQEIPDSTIYYNVKVQNGELPAAGQYQAIPESETSLYLTLPPLPGKNTILVDMPGDGTPPAFGTLFQHISDALKNDPIDGVTPATLINSSAHCRRIAYDIVWSYQSDLPALPDPLESLYTNPPNPGGGGSGSSSSNYEMDRQKFEGALKSFYSTRNASAERLTKFVAAASAAVACEQLSRSATTALLEFPVDPSAALAGAVESEILLQGLGAAGTAGLDFGVPAAFFYVLGASLDQTTNAEQRFQMATGDSVERLLHHFGTATDTGLIGDSERFSDDVLDTGPQITPFQAARRLAALAASAASGSPSVTVLAGSPLASVVKGWRDATDPSGTQSPPPSYQENDFTVWTQQMAVQDPQGYLDLDLDALTRGFVIPPFAASPAAEVASGSTLTFGPGSGIGPGMPVTGPGIAPGTTVTSVDASGVVTLQPPVTGTVATTSLLVFNYSILPVTASTTGDCKPGEVALAFGDTTGISAGMTVLGEGIAAGTTVLSVTNTGVTLSRGVTADVGPQSQMAFVTAPGSALPAVTSKITKDCDQGTNMLTFAAATGISVGMTAVADGLPSGTTVLGVTATTAALSANATAKLKSGSPITFALAAGGPLPSLAATTTQDCPSGTNLLTCGGSGGTGSISVGMSAFGAGLAAGSTVADVTASTVSLSPGVTADVPGGSLITFAFLPSTLADQIAAWLPQIISPAPDPTVATLKQVTAAQWTAFFTQPGSPQWLPAFTQPVAPGISSSQATPQAGYLATRTRAFVRAVQQFFTVSTVATAAQLPPAGTPATLDVPEYDPIGLAAENMNGFQFGGTLSDTALAAAAQNVLPGDPAGQAWLAQAMTTINELWEVAAAAPAPGTLPPEVSFKFSVMEALYARGFRDAADITGLSGTISSWP